MKRTALTGHCEKDKERRYNRKVKASAVFVANANIAYVLQVAFVLLDHVTNFDRHKILPVKTLRHNPPGLLPLH
jgi:hypothetical protein